MIENELVFNSQAVRPLECLSRGWAMIKDRYWLFLGIALVGVLLGSIGPLGILMGPCMCGIYYCLMRHEFRRPVEFGMLFKGFDYFLQSWIASLLMLIPLLVVIVPAYIVFFVSILSTMGDRPANAPPDPAQAWAFLGMMAVFYLVIIAIALVVHMAFIFAYPLIVDRGLSGVDAVKASFRAAFANLGGVAGLVLLNAALGFVGVLCCYVGAFFVMPITFAATLVAYRQVFPEPDVVSAVPPHGQ
jgi:hypothetical protein